MSEYIPPSAAVEEELDDAMWALDWRRLQELMAIHAVDPNYRIETMPLVHRALDSEVELGKNAVDSGNKDYVPTGDCLRVLLQLGADPQAEYLGQTLIETVAMHPALEHISEKITDWSGRIRNDTT
jgi:hypothetical protein